MQSRKKIYTKYLQRQRMRQSKLGDKLSFYELKVVETCSQNNKQTRSDKECKYIIEYFDSILGPNCGIYDWYQQASKHDKLQLIKHLQYTVTYSNEVIIWQGSKVFDKGPPMKKKYMRTLFWHCRRLVFDTSNAFH